MKYIVITVLTLLLGFYTSWAQPSNQLVSRSLSAKDGMTSNQVYDIVQDKQGFIWFAGSNGLSRYDGYSFLNYSMLGDAQMKPVQASLGHIRYDAQSDLLWINTSLFNISCYSLKEARFLDYTGRGDYMRAYRHVVYDGNTIWMFDAKEGIRHLKYGNGQFVCTDYTPQNGHRFVEGISHLYIDQAHHAWVTTKNGIYFMDSYQPHLKLKEHAVSAQCIADKMAFLTDRGMLYLYDSNGKLLKKKHLDIPHKAFGNISASVGWNQHWILFGKHETYAINLNTLTVSKPADFQLKDARLIESEKGNEFVSSKNGDMIVFTSKGFYHRLNLLEGAKDQGNRYRKYSICAISESRFLIASYGNGAFIYDVNKGVLEHITAGDGRHLLNSNFLIAADMDRYGNIWLAQDEAGVVCISKPYNTFMHYVYPDAAALIGSNANAVLRVLYDKNGKLQIVTKNKNCYPLASADFVAGAPVQLPFGIYASLKDSKGHFWEGTRGGGLYVDGKLCLEQGKGEEKTINDVYSMAEDKWGRIWIATIKATTRGGLILTRYQADKPLEVKRFFNSSEKMSNVHYLCMDARGVLWMATNEGLGRIDTRQRNITEKSFLRFNVENGMLPFGNLLTVRCASNGEIWAGGIGTGLLRCKYDEKTGQLKYEQYTIDNGLGSNNVYSILQDPAGNIWAGTESGLARFDMQTGRIDNNVINEDVQGNSYQENSAQKLSDGTLLFGTNNGMVVVNPYQASIARASNSVVPTLTDLLINGVSIYKMQEYLGSPGTIRRISLSDGQNTLTFSFSNFDFAHTEISVYQYYLEGVDKTWNHVTNKNSVSYNGLQPGDYVFHLRSMGHGNLWSKERTLKIHISQPWYNRWYAWVVYLLVVCIVAYYIFRNRKEKFQLHQRMKMEKQVNDFRINFFTHVTHEFRTPLAIIQSAVSKIMDEKTGAVSRASVQTAVRGTKRLSRLVTQLMEFRKINSDGLRLQVLAGVDIVGFVRNIYQDFWYAAKQKDIVMNYQIFEKRHEMTCDRHIVETVVYNLLSNAVKYTPARGEVNVRMEADENQNVLRIIVSDSGTGISEEQQKSLFQPFMHGYVSQGGMGIGLYVAKMMAETHHGSLTYRKSEKLGGAEFIFSIPLSDDDYVSEEYLDTMALADNQTSEQDEQQLENVKEMLPEALNNVTVAVIEDDPDMLDQIRSELAVFFKVVTYSNGKQGLEGVLAEKPALLVCDVMLPDMNGYDIVKQIKKQPDGYALPVIMLTALNDEKHQIKGYKAGADDYMVKPCNFNLLVARIVQLVTWSQNLPKVSGPTEAAGASSAILTKSLDAPKAKIVEGVVDKNVLKNFETMVAQHLSDPNFTIDSLAEMMHMGRTKLYGKIKELTGETPNKYIMRQRMTKAAELLLTGDYTVSDVCYKVGLEDVSYFNKCFKSYYGVSPSKYGK